ncbi:Nif3-like dinuclear metal center hexameric protein [Microcella daejeonensis]|uniref:Nif3-like dinuclear metal center hexameric protein n=1 Tax=Microcella daejeonensis TaxID=2994971 RepID=UPI002271C9DC|nr:Nif3-like dinuclear metal center hexameric protein [Microcella daejeonensis]WAB83281.1 Nif3-like dinuclear metal center hexameric protein [Microcella daejeonensis]
MPPTLADVTAAIERLWPLDGAESWDAAGLLSGDPAAPVTRILLAVDAVRDTVDEAVEAGADLLLVHHPLLMRGVTTVAETTAKGALLATLIRGGCALVAAHTNADVVETGTSGRLAALLGLVDPTPVVETGPGRGLGRVGALPEPITLGALARRVAGILPATAGGVRVAGEFDRVVRTVALCGGAGDSLLGEAAVRTADVYLTSDLRHHPASEARETARVTGGPALIDVSHWASEWLWLDTAAEELRRELPGVEIVVSELRTDPWDFVVLP